MVVWECWEARPGASGLGAGSLHPSATYQGGGPPPPSRQIPHPPTHPPARPPAPPTVSLHERERVRLHPLVAKVASRSQQRGAQQSVAHVLRVPR